MSLGRDATSEMAKAEVEEHGKVLKGGPAATAQVGTAALEQVYTIVAALAAACSLPGSAAQTGFQRRKPARHCLMIFQYFVEALSVIDVAWGLRLGTLTGVLTALTGLTGSLEQVPKRGGPDRQRPSCDKGGRGCCSLS